MISIKSIFQAPKIQAKFVQDYCSMIWTFKSHVYFYENGSDKSKEITPIRNTDLWIESFIKFENHYIYSNVHALKDLEDSIKE